VRARGKGLDSALDESSGQLKTGDLLSRSGPQLNDFLHQWLNDRHFLFRQVVPPGHSASKIADGTEFFEPESLPDRGLILGIEPFRLPKGIVFGRPQVKVVNLRPHNAVEVARLIG
jgi:hypothetical protein